MNKMAVHHRISRRSKQRIVQEKLGLRSLRKRKPQLLMKKNKADRVRYARVMRPRLENNRLRRTIFSDERYIELQASFGARIERVLAASSAEVPAELGQKLRKSRPGEVRVYMAASLDQTIKQIFIPEGLKLNHEFSIERVLVPRREKLTCANASSIIYCW